MRTITEKELLQKVEEGVSKKVVWQKPLLLLTENGDDYNYILDQLNNNYRSGNINTDPFQVSFTRVNNKLELSINGVICDGHEPEIDFYDYLGGYLGYDETVHRYCIDLLEYENKPVISLICVTDTNCSPDSIPVWMEDSFDIAKLVLSS